MELIHSFKVVIIFSVSGTLFLGPADTVIKKRDEGVLGREGFNLNEVVRRAESEKLTFE